MIGRTLGNYRIVEQIGIGGMATVYKAYDPDTDRYVAVKILPHHFSHDPTFKERFQREAKAIAKLEHLHILPIFSYGEDDDIAYMAMRYLQAGTLTDRISQGALPLPEASRILNQIASALDHAHSFDILHRDIKPSNVLLDEAGNAFLTDFGIAKMVESTLTGADILGTPAYMSPEQCQGSRDITTASDIYSLGIVLYEMVTGRTPFQAETPIALIHMQLTKPLPMPGTLRPGLPQAAENVILKALSKTPESRYKTCGEMAIAFSKTIAGQPVAETPVQAATSPVSPPPPLSASEEDATVLHKPGGKTAIVHPPAASRRWLWPVVAAALVIVGVVAAGLIFTLMNQGEEGDVEQQAASQSEEAVAVETEPQAASPSEEAVAVETEPEPATQPELPPEPAFELPPERIIEPCDWTGEDGGLCIYPLGEDHPQKILEDAGLDFEDAPTWSPDGQSIAFSARTPEANEEFAIYTANPDGSDLAKLPGFGDDLSPVWSPDGQWLAFRSYARLALMHPDGSEPTIVVDNNDGEICVHRLQWSPDSERIAAFVQVDGCNWEFPMTREIWIVSGDVDAPHSQPIDMTVFENDDYCTDTIVAFSPNGSQVAYIGADCDPYLLNADGSGEPEPIDYFPWEWTARVYPQWLGEAEEQEYPPEEEEKEEREPLALKDIVRVEPCPYTDQPGPGFCIFNLEGENIARILEDEELNTHRFWGESFSPDGRRLIFSAARPGDTENHLYLANLDGSGLEELPIPGNAGEPTWSPDGERVVFHLDGDLVILDPEIPENRERILTWQEVGCSFRPQWSPDSERVVVSVHPDGCEWEFPVTREILIVDPYGDEINHIATTTHNEDQCGDMEVAFSPDGEQVAYIDWDCQTYLVNADGSGSPEPFNAFFWDDFPKDWTSIVHPQWPNFDDQ